MRSEDSKANKPRIHVEEKNGDGLDLIFESVRKKNQGVYACKATIKGQEVDKKFNLTVFSESLLI